jgi:hypothetical protein
VFNQLTTTLARVEFLSTSIETEAKPAQVPSSHVCLLCKLLRPSVRFANASHAPPWI